MSVFWFAVGVLVLMPLLIIQQRRIAELRRSRKDSPGCADCRLRTQTGEQIDEAGGQSTDSLPRDVVTHKIILTRKEGVVTDISESKRAAEARCASQREFCPLAERLPDCIVRYDDQARVSYVNPRFEETVGHAARDMLGKTPQEVFPDGRYAAYQAQIELVIATGREAEIELSLPDVGAGVRHHLVRIVAERGPGGKIVGALAMGRDITERHNIQRQLEIHSMALDTSNDAVFLVDDTLRFVFVNETACRSLGYSREELLTMGPADIDPDITIEIALGAIEAMAASSELQKFETRHQTKDGRIYPVEIGGALFKYGGKNFGLSVARDISERKHIEGALRFVARRGWRIGDRDFFDALVRYLVQALGVDYAMVAILGEAPGSAETVALCAKGAVVENIRYDLAGTPCDDVMGKSYCSFQSGVQQLFPEDSLLVEMGAESYAGIPLMDSNGELLGLIAVLDGKPLQNEVWVAQSLQVVAPRAAAELERARSDALLRAREREFRSLAESAPDCIIRYDRAGRILYLNSRLMRELGIAAATDVVGRSTREIWPDGRFAAIEQAVAQAMETARDVTIETMVIQPSGELACSQIRIVPEWDDAGAVIGAIAFGRDITELKRYQQTLSAREQEFRSLAENAPDNIVRFDHQGRVLYVNTRLAKTLEVVAGDVVGKMAQEIIPSWDIAPINTALLTGDPAEIEFAVPDRHGMLRQYQIRLVAERGAQGDIVGALGIGRDVTRKKRIERELLILGSAINSATDSIFLVNERQQFAYVNDRACRALGYSRDELLTMGPADIDAGIPRDKLERMNVDLFAHGPQLGRVITRHRAADGRIFPVELTASLVVHEDEKICLVVACDITERKRAERELLILSSAINNASDSIFLVNEQLQFTYVNDRACRVLGFSRDELLTMGPADLDTDVSPEELARMRTYLLTLGQQVRTETRARVADDRPIVTEVTASLVEHENERMALVVARDITERKRAERELLILSAAVNAASDSIFLIDEQVRFVYVNDQACRSLGYSRDELLTMGAADIDHDMVHEDLVRLQADFLAHGSRANRLEALHRAADGSVFPVEVSTSVVEHENDRLSVAVVRDITERKRMENELRFREEEFRSLAENMPDIVKRYDLECRYVYVNPAYLREIEAQADEVLMAPPDARHWRSSKLSVDDYKAWLQRVMTTGEPAELMMDWTRSSDGVAAEYAIRLVPERDADGRVVGALCIGRNVIKLLESEHRLEESRQQLRNLAARREDAREEERRHIARELHDELGQQLSALRFNLTLLAYDFGEAQPPIREAVDKLLSLVSKTIRTTREVSSALRPAVLDMGVVPALEWLVAEYAPHGGVSFELTGNPGDVDMNAACTLVVFRVVQESLTNAVRHSKADRIEVVFGRDADTYVVKVRDNGVGFHPDAPRDRRSIGLLGIRERALAVGGELVVSSAPGKGTVLQVRIPAGQIERRSRD